MKLRFRSATTCFNNPWSKRHPRMLPQPRLITASEQGAISYRQQTNKHDTSSEQVAADRLIAKTRIGATTSVLAGTPTTYQGDFLPTVT